MTFASKIALFQDAAITVEFGYVKVRRQLFGVRVSTGTFGNAKNVLGS